MKVVVTGGAGFIGANLCRHLSTSPQVSEVVAFDNLSSGFRLEPRRSGRETR
ncbi:MAG: NAD-dependent epimerase/dehydratase family protein [Microthrixaceae bacterium]